MNTPTFDHLVLQKDDVNFIIYHGDCTDGFTGAFAGYQYLTSINALGVTYFPANHNVDVVPVPDVTGKNVCMIDFCYKKPVLDVMLQTANRLIILDHHKTAQNDLTDIGDQHKVFRMDYSGASLAWLYFHGPDNIPDLISYVQDTDIYTKRLPNTNEYSSYIYLINHTFNDFLPLLDNEYLKQKALTEGSAICKSNQKETKSAVNNATIKFTSINGKYYFVAYCNSSVLKSDIGNQVLARFKNANFSAIYSITDKNNTTAFSLRSLNERTDVSAISKFFNAGGHRNASGACIYNVTSTLPGITFDSGELYNTLHTIYYKIMTIQIDNSGEQNINLHAVYLNSSVYKYQLGAYLLQPRTIEIDNNTVTTQEAICILRNQNIPDFNVDKCDIAIVYDFDPLNNKIWHTVVIEPLNISDAHKNILKTYLKTLNDYKEYNQNEYIFTTPIDATTQ